MAPAERAGNDQPEAEGPEEKQRRRIIEVLTSLVAEQGYAAASLDSLMRMGVERSVFERHFESFDACVTAAWERSTQEFMSQVGVAYAEAGSWLDGIRAAAWAYCRFLQEDHDRARFSIELGLSRETAQASRDFIMDGWAELIHLGRFENAAAGQVPRARAEAIVGAIWERQVMTIRQNDFERLPSLIPEAMYITVLPYLGPEAAEEELRRGPDDIAAYHATGH